MRNEALYLLIFVEGLYLRTNIWSGKCNHKSKINAMLTLNHKKEVTIYDVD